MAKMNKTATGKNRLKNMSDTNLLLMITVIVFFLSLIHIYKRWCQKLESLMGG